MLLTIKQAEQVWCPMVRHEGDAGSFNRSSTNCNPVNHEAGQIATQRYGCHCIADRCAMWRWEPTGTTHREARIVNDFPGQKRITHIDVPDTPTQGFCGLAGKPLI